VELILIRHAEPEWSKDGRAVDEPGLTDRGHHQAALMSRTLADEHFDEILVSPLQRARETAIPLLAEREVEPHVLPWLAEISSPTWDGQPDQVAIDAFDTHRNLPAHEQWAGLDGGEAVDAFGHRIESGVTDWLAARGVRRAVGHDLPLWTIAGDTDRAARRTERVAIVAHAGTNAMMIGVLLGIAPVPWSWERLSTGHSSVTRLIPFELGGSHAYQLAALGDLEHVPRGLRTR